MTMFEDFDLDVTTNEKQENILTAGYATIDECHTKCDSCGECSASCYGMSNRPCDR